MKTPRKKAARSRGRARPGMAVAEHFVGRESAHVAYLAMMLAATACLVHEEQRAPLLVHVLSASTDAVMALLVFANLAALLPAQRGVRLVCVYMFASSCMQGLVLRRGAAPGVYLAGAAAGSAFAYAMQRRAFRKRLVHSPPPAFDMDSPLGMAFLAIACELAVAVLHETHPYMMPALVTVVVCALLVGAVLDAATYDACICMAVSRHLVLLLMYNFAQSATLMAGFDAEHPHGGVAFFACTCAVVLAASSTASLWTVAPESA